MPAAPLTLDTTGRPAGVVAGAWSLRRTSKLSGGGVDLVAEYERRAGATKTGLLILGTLDSLPSTVFLFARAARWSSATKERPWGFLAIIGAATIAFLSLGWYLGWYRFRAVRLPKAAPFAWILTWQNHRGREKGVEKGTKSWTTSG